jgi:flagellar hook assembly protein FlgD
VSLLARAVFVLLVGATFAAFFVAQRLKSAPTVIGLHHVVQDFSPNDDGRRDASTMRVRVKERDDVTVTIVDAAGTPVRRLVVAQELRAGSPLRLSWDGRDDAGARSPDGIYRVRVGLRRQGRALTFPRDIRLDTTAPAPRVERLDGDGEAEGQQWIVGPVPSAVNVAIRNPSRRGPSVLRVLRTDAGTPEVVARFTAPPGATAAAWDGRLEDGTEAPAGTYLISVSVRDLAGNVGTSPPLPPQRGDVPGVPGLSVRRLLARPPGDPVRAGGDVTFAVDSRGRPFRWRIRRPGAGRPVESGRRRTGGELTFEAPDGPSGVYLFEARAGRTSADTTGAPFAVQGDEAAPILVVLPAITWFGSSAIDEGRDGLPDTLAAGAPSLWPRLLTGLPSGFPDEIAPLLVFLDRQKLRYDVTTDLALAASRSGLTEDRRGVLLPGPLRWVPRSLAQRLREYAAGGGTVASFGADTLRRGVEVTRTRLRRPLPPVADDPFGARLRPVRRLGEEEGVLQPVADEGGSRLLTGIDTLSGFGLVEESEPSERVEVALAAVDDEAIAAAEEAGEALPITRPALTLARVGDGRVIRVGLPEWGLRLQTDPAVRQLTRNIADILRGARPRIRF